MSEMDDSVPTADEQMRRLGNRAWKERRAEAQAMIRGAVEDGRLPDGLRKVGSHDWEWERLGDARERYRPGSLVRFREDASVAFDPKFREATLFFHRNDDDQLRPFVWPDD